MHLIQSSKKKLSLHSKIRQLVFLLSFLKNYNILAFQLVNDFPHILLQLLSLAKLKYFLFS